jgi:hypothetical protein
MLRNALQTLKTHREVKGTHDGNTTKLFWELDENTLATSTSETIKTI